MRGRLIADSGTEQRVFSTQRAVIASTSIGSPTVVFVNSWLVTLEILVWWATNLTEVETPKLTVLYATRGVLPTLREAIVHAVNVPLGIAIVPEGDRILGYLEPGDYLAAYANVANAVTMSVSCRRAQ